MDYFAKFRKRIAPPKQEKTSAMHLANFHKCWDYVHNIFIAEDRKANLHVKQTEIPERLHQMVDMLVDEEARLEDNTTGGCMEYFLKNGILQYLVNVSEKADYPEGIRGEAIRTTASLVDLLDDRFLVHNSVHKPTVKLLRFCVLDERQSEIDHGDLVDLMYIICSKIHGFPDLLNIFFHDKQWLTTPQKSSPSFKSETTEEEKTKKEAQKPEYEFLLFTYLLRYVHREGRSGDFARTGLLFLMEMATGQLGDFILDSDFATIMAAALGALYSQLPRKLIIKDDAQINSSPAAYLLGQDLDPRSFPSELGVEQSNSEQFKYQLDSFLKLLEFCQDVLMRCPNPLISDRLLQSVRMIFLQNILYPSILECSDIDGSSVAVISYIDLILQTLQQDDLADVIVGFLVDQDDEDEDDSNDVHDTSFFKVPDSVANGSNNLFAGVEFNHFKSSPYFTVRERFTLKDLIFSRLKSSSQPTVIATLKLLKTVIVKHCKFALRLLTIVSQEEDEAPTSAIGHHIREIELYFSLVSAIDKTHADDILSLGYEDYLKDIELLMDNDSCFQTLLCRGDENLKSKFVTSTSKSERRRSFKYGQRESKQEKLNYQPIHHSPQMTHHKIKPTDTLLQILLGLLSHFFAQSSELNLALTGVISALATCPYRSLEGWVGFSESDRTNPDDILILSSSDIHQKSPPTTPPITSSELYSTGLPFTEDSATNLTDDEDDDRSIDFGAEKNSVNMTAPVQFKSFPPFYTLFRTLTQQVDYYRSEVDGFDKLLDERWNGLLFGEIDILSTSTSATQPAAPTRSTSIRRGSTIKLSTSSSASTATTTAPTMKSKGGSMGKLFSVVSGSNNSTSSSINGNSSNNNINSSNINNSSNTTNDSTHSRRPSIVLKPSTSTSTLTSLAIPSSVSPNPSKSISSSTAANNNTSSNQPTHSPIPNIPVINPLSPLALHAKRTLQVRIQPLFPSNFEIDRDENILDLDEEDEDMFAPKPTNPSQSRRMDKTTEISLSMLLNNVVILEEAIKELVAIMQVRKSMGIDRIRYA
ncbi:hypothetical protein K501DRAFT_337310 [Backusella circina FSU 941]|nr:hypothetical protein K501DRAFT_337310 [Backusella circina FSU 941]